jgi:hypothetical protein
MWPHAGEAAAVELVVETALEEEVVEDELVVAW